jgi:hypothetical protein
LIIDELFGLGFLLACRNKTAHYQPMTESYPKEDVEKWLKLKPEERLVEAEGLWEEFKVKYNRPWKPFSKSFSSHRALRKWLAKTQDPRLW